MIRVRLAMRPRSGPPPSCNTTCGRRLGVGIPQALGQSDQFLQVFRVSSEMLLVAPIVDRLQRIFLKDEGTVDDVADRPIAFAELLVPFTLAGRSLGHATGPTNFALDDFPGHGLSPEPCLS